MITFSVPSVLRGISDTFAGIVSEVGEYAGRPLSSSMAHHRRPKVGPAIQSSQRERNLKGSRWLLCA